MSYPGDPDSAASGSSVVGKGLSIIGRHCYAYNLRQQTTSADTMLDFTSGAFYVVADLVLCAAVKMPAGSDGGIVVWELKLNNDPVAMYKTDSVEEDMPSNFVAKILIPPFTNFILSGASNYSTSGFYISAQLIGTIHATRNGSD